MFNVQCLLQELGIDGIIKEASDLRPLFMTPDYRLRTPD